jgi:hypothetical protein
MPTELKYYVRKARANINKDLPVVQPILEGSLLVNFEKKMVVAKKYIPAKQCLGYLTNVIWFRNLNDTPMKWKNQIVH